MSPASQTWVRAVLFGCAVILALQALWLIAPEISRVGRSAPAQTVAAAELPVRRDAAAQRAAWLGFVRGDLWSELVLNYSALVFNPAPEGAQSPTGEALQHARSDAERALRHSPHNSRVWLLLAALELRTHPAGNENRAAAAVKMAYYTGPGELELVPLRLGVALQPELLGDDEIQQLARQEIQTIVSRKPDLKSAVLAAYQRAGAPARKFIEDVASGQDPNFLRAVPSEAWFR